MQTPEQLRGTAYSLSILHIKRLKRVHRRFTKRLCGLSTMTCKDGLRALGLQSFEARRLQFDLIYTYKIENSNR